MSVDEDTELRDLVTQTLETNGVLGKIRAELRASVFLALEEQDSVKSKTPFQNQELKNFLSTKEGQLTISLVREFLEFFKLEYSLAVFDPESGYGNKFESRSGLTKQLNILEKSADSKLPLISELIKQFQGNNHSEGTIEPLSAQQISEARRKFNEYDKDKSGKIEKNELQNLFIDVFPDVNRNMLDRYVRDEFRVSDKDFSNAIEFGEFLSLYRRVFVLCKSSVSKSVDQILTPKSDNQSKGLSFMKDVSKTSEITNGVEKPLASVVKIPQDNDGDDTGSDEDFSLPDKQSGGLSSFGKGDLQSRVAATTTKPSGSSMSSLAGLPSLVPSSNVARKETTKNDLETINLAGNDYDDDFQESNVSPVGQTPRSARSDKNQLSDDNEEIDEEIEEDLLKSEVSENDDLTTDKTISVAEPSAAGDYFEDVLH